MSTQSTSSVQSKDTRELFGHPVGLYILFMTELWERYSYYGMRALLTLFLTASIASGNNPGFGWDQADAYSLYGWYTMLVYVASIPGGILADKLLGQKRAVLVGGLLLCAGHGVLAIDALWAFYAGLGLIVLGVGFLKPNISTMVGGLYKKGDDRRDFGFYIFYIGINLGAFAAGLTIGPLGEEVNWHYGFGLAGIGMFIGQIIYIWGMRFLKGVGEPPKKAELLAGQSKEPNMIQKMFSDGLAKGVFFITLAAGFSVMATLDWAYGLLLAGMSIVFGLITVMFRESDGIERDRLKVLLLSFLIVIVFWGAFEQAGGLMNVYTKEKTDRFISLDLVNILFASAVGLTLIRGIWLLIKRNSGAKYWLVGAVGLAAALGLLRMFVIDSDPYEVPATVFQSVNSFFIFTLATTVGAIWYKLKMKGKETSSLLKMAVGVIIMGWGFFFMTAASMEASSEGSSAMYWLIFAYLFHTIGELCLSPVSLSFITKLAPVKYVSFVMGIYFAATGFGNKLAGILGEWSAEAGELEIFTGIAVFCTVFGFLVIAILKPLKRLTHGAEDAQLEDEGEVKEAQLTEAELA